VSSGKERVAWERAGLGQLGVGGCDQEELVLTSSGRAGAIKKSWSRPARATGRGHVSACPGRAG